MPLPKYLDTNGSETFETEELHKSLRHQTERVKMVNQLNEDIEKMDAATERKLITSVEQYFKDEMRWKLVDKSDHSFWQLFKYDNGERKGHGHDSNELFGMLYLYASLASRADNNILNNNAKKFDEYTHQNSKYNLYLDDGINGKKWAKSLVTWLDGAFEDPKFTILKPTNDEAGSLPWDPLKEKPVKEEANQDTEADETGTENTDTEWMTDQEKLAFEEAKKRFSPIPINGLPDWFTVDKEHIQLEKKYKPKDTGNTYYSANIVQGDKIVGKFYINEYWDTDKNQTVLLWWKTYTIIPDYKKKTNTDGTETLEMKDITFVEEIDNSADNQENPLQNTIDNNTFNPIEIAKAMEGQNYKLPEWYTIDYSANNIKRVDPKTFNGNVYEDGKPFYAVNIIRTDGAWNKETWIFYVYADWHIYPHNVKKPWQEPSITFQDNSTIYIGSIYKDWSTITSYEFTPENEIISNKIWFIEVAPLEKQNIKNEASQNLVHKHWVQTRPGLLDHKYASPQWSNEWAKNQIPEATLQEIPTKVKFVTIVMKDLTYPSTHMLVNNVPVKDGTVTTKWLNNIKNLTRWENSFKAKEYTWPFPSDEEPHKYELYFYAQDSELTTSQDPWKTNSIAMTRYYYHQNAKKFEK